MKSSDIELESTSKLFAFEKISREIEGCNDISTLKETLRCYVKLFLKQQETLTAMEPMKIDMNTDIPPEWDDPLM
tara:strand:- start:388 stop:612 length:225 start_codon:yes stop_codon:yes gene_type:complete